MNVPGWLDGGSARAVQEYGRETRWPLARLWAERTTRAKASWMSMYDRRGGATASSSCAARVWASSYEQHRIDHTSARGVFVPVRNEKGGLESCRAATNCPIFSSKGPDGLSPSKRIFCRLGNTSVILPQRAVAGRPRYLAQIPWVGRHSSPW